VVLLALLNGMPMLCIGFKEAFMKIFFAFVFLVSALVNAQDNHDHHSHEGHLHEQMVDGEKLEVDVERFDKFVKGLKDKQIAVVSVKGMVCDFCAQGIEKTFKKDKTVTKIDVDLNKGKVFIAYQMNTKIDFEKIKKMIVSNGQNATKLQVLKL
jgi:copper chaperone CopZ